MKSRRRTTQLVQLTSPLASQALLTSLHRASLASLFHKSLLIAKASLLMIPASQVTRPGCVVQILRTQVLQNNQRPPANHGQHATTTSATRTMQYSRRAAPFATCNAIQHARHPPTDGNNRSQTQRRHGLLPCDTAFTAYGRRVASVARFALAMVDYNWDG